MSALPPLLFRPGRPDFSNPRGPGSLFAMSLLYTNSLCGPSLERHLVGLLDLRLQSHSTRRGVDHVHHLRKQFRRIRVSGGAGELNGPAQFGRCSVEITRFAKVEALLDDLAQFCLA